MKNNPDLEKNSQVQSCGFSYDRRILTQGRIILPHWHNYYELEIVLGGQIDHTINKKSMVMSQGSVYFLSPVDFHSVKCIEEADIINIAFDESMVSKNLTEVLSHQTNHVPVLNDDDFAYLCERTERLNRERSEDIFQNEVASAIITEILYIILRNLSSNGDFEQYPTLLQSAVNIINQKYQDSINISCIADSLHITPQYLGKIFKEEMNISITDYINNLRLKHACSMLVHTNASVKEIAFESGYNSTEYFLYIFKKNIQATPTKYRKVNTI